MRSCNGCTVCCDGTLFGEAHGKIFQTGRPCHFKCESGCSIYEDRPSICKEYRCAWLDDYDLPEWMKPNLSGVLVTKRFWEKGEYLEVIEANQKVDSVVLNWFFLHHYTTNIPLRIQVAGGFYNYGPEEFLKEIHSKNLNK